MIVARIGLVKKKRERGRGGSEKKSKKQGRGGRETECSQPPSAT